MTAAVLTPARLAEVLREHAHLLGGARFIGRHETQAVDGPDDSRWYHDPGRPGLRYQSVTWTISSTESAPWIVPWAATVAAEVVRDNWSALGGLMRSEGGPALMVKWLKEEARRQRELAADVGTWLHDVLEALLTGRPIPDPPAYMIGRTLRTGGERILITQEALDSWADGILNFITDFRLTCVMSEASICHPGDGWAGRVDVVAEMPGYGLIAIDAKSGNVRKSVIAQLAAIVNAREVWIPGGGQIPMPRCDGAAVLHLRPRWARGYKLRPVLGKDLVEGYAWFLAAAELLREREAAPDVDRSVWYPPVFDEDGDVIDIPKVPMIEDSGLKCARALGRAGLTWLVELEEFTAADVLAVRGVGPKAMEDLAVLLAEHGLSFADQMQGAA